MKKLLFILCFVFAAGGRLFAQEDDDDNNGNEKIRDKMNEYIQIRLGLSKDEAEKFTPVFIRYFKEWRQTLRECRGLPKLDRQQKIIDLRLRFRAEFRDIIGEKRGDQVFQRQDDFIRELQAIRNNRIRNNPPVRPLNRPRIVNNLR